MNKIFLLFRVRRLVFINSIRFASKGDMFKKGFLSLIAVFFLAGLYSIFYRIFIYLMGVPLLGPLLLLRLISMVFLTFFAMLIFSNIITSFSTIYFSSEIGFLLSHPLSFRDIFVFKYFQTLVYSSWMVVLALVPLLIGYGRANSAPLMFYLWSFALLIPFFIICSGLGITCSLIVMRLFPTKKTRDVFVVLGIVLIGGVYLLIRLLQPEQLVNPDKMFSAMQYLAAIRTPITRFLPSYWVTQAITSGLKNEWGSAVFYFSLLMICAIIIASSAVYIAVKIYYSGWAGAQEAGGSTRKKTRSFDKIHFPVFMPFRALLRKDIKLFFRDTTQWSQLLLLLTLVIVYLFNIYKLPLDTHYLRILIAFLNIGLTGFVLASVSLRFVFPSVSLEGKSFWIIQSTPLALKYFIREKFVISIVPLLVLGECLVLISNVFLKVDTFMFWLSTGTVFILICGLVTLGIGMGACFPSFKTENIAQIESSMGGILYMVFSFFYIGLTLALEALPVRMYFLYKMGNMDAVNFNVIFLTISILVILNVSILYFPFKLGRRSLEYIEI